MLSAALWLCVGVDWPGAAAEVQLTETSLVLPTYRVAPPDPNPRFYQGRTYQGARATFYPYPVQDRLTEIKEDQAYRALVLENDCLQITVLPELGGRLFSAVDKSNGYDFFYRQSVIKPALIGMLGAWISGGVEWNVPHHHRATSFMPVEVTTQTNADGSKTIWVGEIEWRHRLKWIVGLSLHPDRSYIEMTMRLFNRTPFAHAFLFWINPAVHANEQYQVLFPPDAAFAVQHGKPEFARWPIAREIYGGVDYSRGVDISWWKNHPSPVSFFCFHSDQDFFGGYDHGRRAGVLHYADHHVVPGKKFFEWGTGPEGELWSGILTDTDGPYLELMAGAFSDNQPDYSWIQPGEVKSWKHYWYPIRELGGVKAATLDAALNLELTNRVARLALNATAQFPNARARLELEDRTLFETNLTISPRQPFVMTLPIDAEVAPHHLRASLVAADGRELVRWHPPTPRPDDLPLPDPVRRPLPPKDIASIEDLYLTGLRIEQLYSPSFEPAPYYQEAIRRDPGDYRANTALGLLHAKAGRWDSAELHLRAAIERATANDIRPKDGEALYYLGVVLKARGELDAAYDAFQRAAWNHAWQAAAFHALAEIDACRGQFAKALEHANDALARSAFNTKARGLKSALLRRLGRADEAEETAQATLALDPLDFLAGHELGLALRQRGRSDAADRAFAWLDATMPRQAQPWLELASDYAAAGLWTEVIDVLERHLDGNLDAANAHPMVFYHLAHACEMAGRIQSLKLYANAARQSPDFCFPFRLEEERVLRKALEWNPEDARAWYYLGNLLYDHQPEAAIAAWEKSRGIADAFPLVHRNLGLAYAQTRQDVDRAVSSLELAVALNPKEPRFLYELDLQYEAAGKPVAHRLAMLTNHHDTVALRDDALTREIVLLTAAGQHDRAIALLTTRRFHNWEGSGEIHTVYADALLHRGHARLASGPAAQALEDYDAALLYPANLEVGRPYRDRKAAQVHYYRGVAHEALGNTAKAAECFELSVNSPESGPSEIRFAQTLALAKLGRADEARQRFEGLVSAGQRQIEGGEQADYFAKFGEREPERVRKARAHYLIGLGRLGLGRTDDAKAAFAQALELHPAHLGAALQRAALED